ncbi:hypothetical protein [uncultured Pseudomonas sp.]|uniref:hypothetical protein n=1 Tax=uncultured Pseudomonas sp. TaxID=114707 RepID=UPI002046AAF9|nr:hypothetical protein [uncultured Pseudomonas sp.]DAM47905.1 MAG TPA: hypothetical protein [Caudoviricetes sp.]
MPTENKPADPKPTGLSQGWNLTRKHDGFVVGHQSAAYPPDEKAIERAERDGYVWVPFLVPSAQPQPDPMLCRFYDVADWSGLVRELVGHVAQLQESAKRNVKPWEDTFPPTLLPAYIERVNTANSAAPPQGDGVNWKGVADQQKGIIEQQQNLIASLRAELAESYRIDSKLNGEPVHMVRSHGSCCWEEMSGESLEMCQAQPGEYEVRTLYAEQPAPVAVALPIDPGRERLMEIVQQYPNVDPLKYDAAVRTLRK